MKTLKHPHIFSPQAGVSAEDFNKNYHHTVTQFENINSKRYGYSSIRIPFAVYAENTIIGDNPPSTADDWGPASGTKPGSGGGSVPPAPYWNPRRLHSRNHESLRTFSFSPPYDVRVTRMECFVVSSKETPVEVSFVVEPGGEGYPPRPPSVLPVGFSTDKDIHLDKYHPVLNFNIDTDMIGENVFMTSNQEYLLKGGKCYRIHMASPAPSTYFKSAYVDLTLQYDRFNGEEPPKPDLDFVNSNDAIEKQKIIDNLQATYDKIESQLDRLRTMKGELYYYGLGNMNGYWKRPSKPSGVTPTGPAYKSTVQAYSNVLTATDNVWDANDVFRFISDFEQFWFTEPTYVWTRVDKRTLLTETAFNFFSHTNFRSPMAPYIEQWQKLKSFDPSNPEITLDTFGLNHKVLLGYSLGLLHNDTYHHCMFSSGEGGFHYGIDYFASIGHGLQEFSGLMSDKPHFWAGGSPYDPLSTANNMPSGATRGSEYLNTGSPADTRDKNFRAPRLNNQASDPPAQADGYEYSPDILQTWAKTDTIRASTTVPSCVNRDDILDNTNTSWLQEKTVITGKATGFPGTYLAEVHSKTPVDIRSYNNAGQFQNFDTGTLSCNPEIFGENRSPDSGYINALKTNDILVDLFITIATELANSGKDASAVASGGTPRDASMMYRHLQKMYLLLWVG